MRALEIFFFFMAFASCQATTSLMACACASSKMFSFFKKSSMLDPIFFLFNSHLNSALLQYPLAVDRRDDQHLVTFQSVDDPVAVDDKLPYVLIVKFRHLTSCLREACQNPCLIHNVLEDNAGVGGRIGSNVIGDGIEILRGA